MRFQVGDRVRHRSSLDETGRQRRGAIVWVVMLPADSEGQIVLSHNDRWHLGYEDGYIPAVEDGPPVTTQEGWS